MKTVKRIILWRVLPVLVVLALLVSVGITLNERYWHRSFLPSWQQIYAACGFVKPTVPDDELHITVMDVGDADCILLQSGDKNVLIDAGRVTTTDAVLDALYAAGVDRFDYIIASHFDYDHIGGMAEIIRAFGCDRILLPTIQTESAVYDSLMNTLRQQPTIVTMAEYGQTFSFGNAVITIVSEWKRSGTENDRSIVCRITFGKHAFLFTGDISAKAERALLETDATLSADVIKVSHHGSKDASDPKFLAKVDPTYAVISCAADDMGMHPHANTLETLASVGATVYRTDVHGKIFISSDGETLSVTGEYT